MLSGRNPEHCYAHVSVVESTAPSRGALKMMTAEQCDGCRSGGPFPFQFTMAFQPIVDLSTRSIWGYEALVRGVNGEGAGTILAEVNKDNLYKFDQACRV